MQSVQPQYCMSHAAEVMPRWSTCCCKTVQMSRGETLKAAHRFTLLWQGSAAVIRLLLQHEECDVDATDDHQSTALHLACQQGNAEVMRHLLRQAQTRHRETGRIVCRATWLWQKVMIAAFESCRSGTASICSSGHSVSRVHPRARCRWDRHDHYEHEWSEKRCVQAAPVAERISCYAQCTRGRSGGARGCCILSYGLRPEGKDKGKDSGNG